MGGFFCCFLLLFCFVFVWCFFWGVVGGSCWFLFIYIFIDLKQKIDAFLFSPHYNWSRFHPQKQTFNVCPVHSRPTHRPSVFQNGVNYSPKHGISLRPELCVVLFKRDNNISSTLVDGIIKHLDDGRMSDRSHYTIEGSETLRQIPRVKLYLVISEMEEKCGHSFLRPQDVELHASAIRFMKSLGGNC